MRKESKKLLEELIIALNKDIIDLDRQYLRDEFPDINLDVITEEARYHLSERHFVCDKLLAQNPKIQGRFQISYAVMKPSGNRIQFTVMDRKTQTSLETHLNWFPLKGRHGWHYLNELMKWLSEALATMKRKQE